MTDSNFRFQMVDPNAAPGSRVVGIYNSNDDVIGDAVEYWMEDRLEWFVTIRTAADIIGRFYIRPVYDGER